jgi:hypothetical protein
MNDSFCIYFYRFDPILSMFTKFNLLRAIAPLEVSATRYGQCRKSETYLHPFYPGLGSIDLCLLGFRELADLLR